MPASAGTTRYSPEEFHQLTSRASLRRQSSPHFTPDFWFERAHEPPPSAGTKAASTATGSSTTSRQPAGRRAEYPSDTLALDATNDIGPAPFTSSGCTANSTFPDKRGRSSRSSRRSSTVSTRSRRSSRTELTDFKPCVIEDDQGIAQSFLESVNAAISPPDESHKESATPVVSAETCECCCRCGRSPKWRPSARGQRRSKSYTALRTGISELSSWDLDSTKPCEPQQIDPEPRNYGSGESPLERLPAEVLDDIISSLALDLPPAGYAPRNVDLISCLLTSKTIHVATINTLYKNITVPHSSIFSKFHNRITEQPGLGTLVRRLDLSHFTSVGLGRSRQANSEIQNLTSQTLLRCLQQTPAIQEILLQENLDDDIDETVLQQIFFHLPKLRALDLCASSSLPFVDAVSAVLNRLPQSPGPGLSIKRLSLHECFTLPSSAFEQLLPHLTQLTHLDVAHTRITDKALQSLPETARLSHLNLGRCQHITGEGVVDVLIENPAMDGLVYLNLACDVARYRLLEESDVDRLLPALPSTLRSLNLNGAHINQRHIPQLLPLTRHLEELGISHADLSLAEINALFRPVSADGATTGRTGINSESRASKSWKGSDIVASSSPAAESSSPPSPYSAPPTLHYLDLSCIPSITQSSLFHTPAPTNILLTPATLPLEVIELGDKAISSLRECRNTNKRLGWCIKELGRRGWYVREPQPATSSSQPSSPPSSPKQPGRSASYSSNCSSSSSSSSPLSTLSAAASSTFSSPSGSWSQVGANSGRRSWKMGAMWWGMRKCPVAWGEVGGLYGHYMFKK